MGIGGGSLTIMEGNAESVLLLMLLLKHLGKVSKHMSEVNAVPAQGQKGDQLPSVHPADSQVLAFTSPFTLFVSKEDGEKESERLSWKREDK